MHTRLITVGLALQFDMELRSKAGPGSVSSRGGASDVFYSPRVRSPGSSMGESVRSFQDGSPEALEAVILSRINAICQPGVYARARQAQVHNNTSDIGLQYKNTDMVCRRELDA